MFLYRTTRCKSYVTQRHQEELLNFMREVRKLIVFCCLKITACDPTKSHAIGDGLTSGEVNIPSQFKIIAKNGASRQCPCGGVNWVVTVTGNTACCICIIL